MSRRALFAAAAAALTLCASGAAQAQAQAQAVTPYGVRSASAPAELDLFAFLVGRWEGTAKAKLPDGTFAETPVTWIGRWVLDGQAIADEFHSVAPDGGSYLGVSLRRFDPAARAWTVEYVNVTGNFIRRQVNARSGSVTREGDSVVVTAVDGDNVARESYRMSGRDLFVYRIDLSEDRGRTWDTGSIEVTMRRADDARPRR
jgi:hypothetical protein